MFLTRDQLAELTDSPQRSRQMLWLNQSGIRFLVSVTGHPKVLQTELERVMLSELQAVDPEQPKWHNL